MRIQIRRLIKNSRILGILAILGGIISPVPNALLAQNSVDNKEAKIHAMTFSQLQNKFYKAEIEHLISIEVHEMPLEQALREIAHETGLRLSYRGDIMVEKIVSLKEERISVSKALATVLEGTGLDYKISQNGYLLITEAVEDVEDNYQEVVRGRVIDSRSGEALPGVNVVVEGSSASSSSIIGTTTNLDGYYEIQVPENLNSLVFTYIGYQRLTVTLNNRNEINVELIPEEHKLDDVVVVGYGIQQRSDLTGSVSSIRGQALTAESVANPVQALQGRATGVQVVGTGDPGSSPVVRIRGVGTTNNSDPLYVVDGMMIDNLNFLNNNDIESIEVLKDASATAIYGSRGANGVVLITTKQGTSQTPIFTFEMSEGIERPHTFSMVDAWEYATLLNEGLENIGASPAIDLNSITHSTDWFSEVWNQAPTRNYNLSFSQGTENNSYYVGVGMHQQNGIVDKSGYERYSIRVNNQYALNSNITIGHNIVGNWAEKENRPREAFDDIFRIPSTIPVRNDEGNFSNTGISSTSNIVGAIYYHNNFTRSRSIVGNAFVNIQFLDNFQFRSSMGIDLRNAESTNFNPVFFISNTQRREENSINKTWSKNNNWLWENTLSYFQTLKDIHRINAVVGFTAQENNFENLGGGRNDIFAEDPSLWYFNAGSTQGLRNFNSGNSSGIISYLGRLNYTLKDRYLFTGTVRMDGSSRFASDNRWGTFPSLAAGWRISEEDFMQNIDWLSDLKIRGSWGRIGNERIGDYRYFATAATGNGFAGIWNNSIDPGVTVTTLANRNISWETAEQFDIGLEFSFLENRINAEIDWYHKTTNDMLVIVGVPASAGFGATEGNVGSVRNKGLEINLDFRGGTGNWFYSVGVNATTINNKVISLGTENELIGGNIGPGGNVTRAIVGRPIGFFYGYKSLGPFDSQTEIDNAPTQSNVQPGDLRMADLNGDGIIDSNDRTIIGSGLPDYTGGLNLRLGYKYFELFVDMYGSFGNDIYDGNNQSRYSGEDNFSKEWLNRWTGPGTSSDIPRITFGGDWNHEISDRWMYDGSFIKLQNVRFQYTLPMSVLDNLPISMAKIYISGNNLHYFTSYPGLSPEFATSGLNTGVDRNVYPVSAFYQIGASIQF